MIGVALAQLSALGYRDVHLLTGGHPEATGDLIEAYAASDFVSLDLTVNREDSPLGTAGAIYNALPHIPAHSLVAIPGDTIFPFGVLDRALTEHCARGSRLTWLVTTRPGPNAQNAGAVVVDPATRRVILSREGGSVDAHRMMPGFQNVTSTGMVIFERSFFARQFERFASGLERSAVDLYRDLLPWVIQEGHEVLFFDIRAPSPDLGTHDRLMAFRGWPGGRLL